MVASDSSPSVPLHVLLRILILNFFSLKKRIKNKENGFLLDFQNRMSLLMKRCFEE